MTWCKSIKINHGFISILLWNLPVVTSQRRQHRLSILFKSSRHWLQVGECLVSWNYFLSGKLVSVCVCVWVCVCACELNEFTTSTFFNEAHTINDVDSCILINKACCWYQLNATKLTQYLPFISEEELFQGL